MGDSYSDSRFGVPKVDTFGIAFNCNSANAVKATWTPPRNEKGSQGKSKLLSVTVVPTTAGTSTGGNLKIELLKNATSFGVITVNSSTAGAILRQDASIVSASTFSQGDILTIKNVGSDAAGVFIAQAEFQEQFTGTAND